MFFGFRLPWLSVVGFTLLICPEAFAQIEDTARQSPAVAAILDSPRKTPAEQVSAILTLIDLREEEIAAKLWNALGQANFEEAVCAELAEELGTARLLKLARREATFTGARTFVDRCLAAAFQRARDPKRVAQLVADLNAPSAVVRRAARVDLAATGTIGATACLEALAQAEKEQVRANLMFGLTSLQPEAKPLLLAALVDGQGHFRRDVAELAGYLRMKDAVPWLAAFAAGFENDPPVVSAATAALQKMNLPVPGIEEVRAHFRNEIRRLEQTTKNHAPSTHSESLKIATPGLNPWWTFDAAVGQYSAVKTSTKGQQVLATARLAQTLGALPGAPQEDRNQGVIYAYQISQLLDVEPTATVQSLAVAMDNEQLSGALAQAVRKNHIAAAIALAKLLSRRADSESFRSAPLVAAVGHADRELRYTALGGVMKLAPQTSFAGASHVPKALWEFAAGAGAPVAVVASPVAVRASDWAGQLRALGYDATPTTTGRQALTAAFNSPRLSLLLVDSTIGRPLLREVIFQLRSHSRSGRIPIGVLSSLPNLERARRIADRDDRLLAVPRPHNPEAMKSVVDRLKELGKEQATLERRTEQATQALSWIAQLLDKGHPYDELLRGSAVLDATLHTPGLTELSVQALAVTGTARSQQALVGLASERSHPIATRHLAVKAFASSVKRFGKQLTLVEITRQYNRYNASETADEATQLVLGQVLDILEANVVRASGSGVATPGP